MNTAKENNTDLDSCPLCVDKMNSANNNKPHTHR